MILQIIFWLLIAIIFYTYIGYGVLLFLFVTIKEKFKGKYKYNIPSDNDLPHVTLFIAAYNEEDVLEAKCKNCFSLNYPSDKLTILWITDGSSDNTESNLKQLIKERGSKYPKLICEHSAPRLGKSAAFSRGIKFVNTEIVIFTDANTMLNKDAIREIVYNFGIKDVGCVAGEKRVSPNINYKGEKLDTIKVEAVATEGLYWKYESILKDLDWRLYSATGAAGELFAIKKDLFEELPSNILLDDFILSMRIVAKGKRIAYCKNAYAMEGTSANIKEEEKRKIRIAAGGLQSIFLLLPLLNPLKYGVFSFQYISHRVLRWTITPLCMLALIPINICLLNKGFIYVLILLLQTTFYVSGLIGYYLNKINKSNKLFNVVYYFLFMNINVFKGVLYLFGKKDGTWAKAKRK